MLARLRPRVDVEYNVAKFQSFPEPDHSRGLSLGLPKREVCGGFLCMQLSDSIGVSNDARPTPIIKANAENTFTLMMGVTQHLHRQQKLPHIETYPHLVFRPDPSLNV